LNADVQRVAEQLVGQVADALGVKVDPAMLVQLGAAAAGNVVDLVSGKAWRDAKAAGNAAADSITTLQQAEDSAKRPSR
jgi:hypothetical protein